MCLWIVTTLKATSVSHFMPGSMWAWPLCETLHFVGLALLIGVVGMLDLRLLGRLRHLSYASVHSLIPWGILGFVINLVTGGLFFTGAPEQYIDNVAWWYKLAFLGVAGLNVLYFETTQATRALAIGRGDDTPRVFKVIGAVSVLSWFMVLYWGRMLPFIGTAF
jgi:hypothetical protein